MVKRSQKGFTLVELLVVVTIVGILAGMAVVNVKHAQRKASENVLRADLALMRKAIDDFYADKQRYPASLEELVEARYMRRLPADPITQKNDTWILIRDEPSLETTDFSSSEPDPTLLEPGVVDIKSGAEGSTLDNIPYSEL